MLYFDSGFQFSKLTHELSAAAAQVSGQDARAGEIGEAAADALPHAHQPGAARVHPPHLCHAAGGVTWLSFSFHKRRLANKVHAIKPVMPIIETISCLMLVGEGHASSTIFSLQNALACCRRKAISDGKLELCSKQAGAAPTTFGNLFHPFLLDVRGVISFCLPWTGARAGGNRHADPPQAAVQDIPAAARQL